MSNAEIIDYILAAADHYEVLGLSKSEANDAAALRKAYLKRSVRVHPDKNDNSSRATNAFQKVAHAYQILSDESSRAAYDNNANRGDDGASPSSHDTYYASSSAPQQQQQQQPSFRDAMFLFATVVGMMSTSNSNGAMNAASDLAQTLFWAEQMVQQQQQQQDRDGGSSNKLQNKASMAMAVGSSLRVVSSTASMLGFKGSAAKLEQTANMAQMAGMGAMAADAAKDVPVVKQALEQGEKAFRALEKNGKAMEEVGKHVQQLRGSISAVQGFLRASSASQRK